MRTALPAVIALGGNLGDREATLRAAIGHLAAVPGVEVVRVSPVYETAALKPGGVDDEAPAYLNAAALIRTRLDPHGLLAALHDIERAAGRERLEPWGDRTLDLDIVTMGGLTVDDADLVIPHPRAPERAFVLAPLVDVDPHATLGGAPAATLLAAALADGQQVTRLPLADLRESGS